MSMERRSAATRHDPRDQPAYGLAEAARYLKLPVATLRAWTKRPPLLSFSNLIEAHVLRALRTEHGVSVKAVRQAVCFAEQTLNIERLLLRPI